MIKTLTKLAQQFSTIQKQPKKKSRKLLYTGLAFIGFNIIFTAQKTRNYMTNIFLTEEQSNELKRQNKIDIKKKSYKLHDINQQFDQFKPIIIIGGGIIGLSQALKLLQNGYSVVLIEKEKFVSTKCSAFNGNIYNPYLFNPLVSKYSIKSMIQNYFNPTDTATQRFTLSSFQELNGLMWWINALILSTSDYQFDVAIKDMTKLGSIQEQEFEKIKSLGLLQDQLTANGELSFYKSEEYGKRVSSSFTEAGVEYKQVDETQYQHSLDKKLFQNFPYVIKLDKESNLDTKQLSMNTLKYCQTHYPKQFNILYGHEFKDFVLNNNFDCLGINTNQGIIFGSKIIICAGLNSKYIAQKLGTKLPIMPCKGWVIESKIPEFAKGSVLDKMVLKLPTLSITNLNDKLRISGCQYIDRDYKSHDPINEWGAKILIQQMKEQFNIELDEENISVRDCCRPLTPDDKVILCRLGQNRNVFINAGHGSRGMSQCHGCAEVIYQLMKGSTEYQQFDISRFLFA